MHPVFHLIHMTYKETTDYLFNQMPMFEKQGASGYKEGLYNTIELDKHFGHPHQYYKTIHIAGTNGKGSCSHMMAAFLQTCGLKVGLYTSPHLKDFRERIRVNGEPISEKYVVDFVENERYFFEPLHPSFFEVTTALALKYFKDMNVDVAVIEVGLGGRLDCTNIINPVLSIITNISYDHTQFLGNTLREIASEKAGIIKEDTPVIIGEWLTETRPVFEEIAQIKNAPIIFAEDDPEVLSAQPANDGSVYYTTKHYGGFWGDLGGIYQKRNVNTVITAIRALANSKSIFPPSIGDNTDRLVHMVQTAFCSVTTTTGLQGRWQKISSAPLIICDTGHNVGGWRYISKQLKGIECENMHIVIGFVGDKDVDGILDLMPTNAQYYFTKPDSKRALSEIALKTLAERHGLKGKSYDMVDKAFNAAKTMASKNDFIYVGGSSYIVADFLNRCV